MERPSWQPIRILGKGPWSLLPAQTWSVLTDLVIFAGGLALFPGEPEISQCIAEGAMPAGQQNGRQRDHHKNMRPKMFHLVPLRASQPAKCAPLFD